MENSKSEHSNTGYKGIMFLKSCGKFEIYLSYRRNLHYGNGGKIQSIIKRHSLGYYETLKEAIKAREEFIKSLF